MYTNNAYGTGRLPRYGMGGMTAPGMSMGQPLGHLGAQRFGFDRTGGGVGDGPHMGFGPDQYRGGDFGLGGGPADETGQATGSTLGDLAGKFGGALKKAAGALLPDNMEQAYMLSSIVGTGADIYSGIQEGRRADREYEDEQEQKRRRGKLFGEALMGYGASR